jgi:hypothetical protein
VGADPAVMTGQHGQLLAFAANSAAGNPPRQFARGGDGDWLEVKGVLGGYAGTAVTLRGDDLEMVSALTSRNMLLWQRTSAGQWSVGVVASGVVVGTPGVAVGPDGLLHAYGVDANGQLRQFSQGSTGWHEGPVIATGLAPGVGATLQGDAMQLVATGTDGRFRQFSADPTGQWTEHTTNISGLTGAPAVTMGPDGVLHAYGVDTAGQLRQFSQHGGWHEGPLIATGLAPGVSAVLQGDALQVVATGTDGRFRQFSGDPTGQWAEHTTNFSELTGTPTVTVGPDGQLVAFAPGISSRLRQFWQSSDGSWQELAPV